MTVQSGEGLNYKGRMHATYSLPLEPFTKKVNLPYSLIETGETYANILTRQIRMNDNKMGLFNIIQIEGEDNYKYSLITGDEDIEQRIDLVELATVSIVEVKILRSE